MFFVCLFLFLSSESIFDKNGFKYLMKAIFVSFYLVVLQDILEIHKSTEATVRNVVVIIMDSWLAVTA